MKRIVHVIAIALPFFYFTYITQPGHVTKLHFSLAYPTFGLCEEAAAQKQQQLDPSPIDPPDTNVGACKNSDSLDPQPTPTPISPY